MTFGLVHRELFLLQLSFTKKHKAITATFQIGECSFKVLICFIELYKTIDVCWLLIVDLSLYDLNWFTNYISRTTAYSFLFLAVRGCSTELHTIISGLGLFQLCRTVKLNTSFLLSLVMSQRQQLQKGNSDLPLHSN